MNLICPLLSLSVLIKLFYQGQTRNTDRIFSKKSSNLAIIQLETDCTFFASRIIFINKEKEEVREAKDILILI